MLPAPHGLEELVLEGMVGSELHSSGSAELEESITELLSIRRPDLEKTLNVKLHGARVAEKNIILLVEWIRSETGGSEDPINKKYGLFLHGEPTTSVLFVTTGICVGIRSHWTCLDCRSG